VVFILIALAAAAIPYRIGQLQFKEGDQWRKKAETINFQYREVPATRGNIYAGDGSLLATSLPFYRVAIDPTIAKEIFLTQVWIPCPKSFQLFTRINRRQLTSE